MHNQRKKYRIFQGISLLLIGLFALSVFPTHGQAQSGSVTPGEIIRAMNTLRVSNGLPALIEDPIVNAVAQITAETMAANNMSWHIGDVRSRITTAGYGGGTTVWATENFAVGNMSVDVIMQMWADPDHMRPAVNPAYCHVGAGVAQSSDGRYYYILQAAYTSEYACGEYVSPVVNSNTGAAVIPPVSQIIIPVKVAAPDADGRIYHIVQAGQSFWSIAIAYQITIHDLEVWNNLSREKALLKGQKLFIPSEDTAGFASPTPIGMIVQATPNSDGQIVHEVQTYQSLIRIAKAYDIQVDTILALNGLQIDWPLQIGQKLMIYPGNVTPSPTPRPLSAIERLTPASDGQYYHTVGNGEYLAWIADLYEIGLVELLTWNGLDPDAIIRPDQKLLLQVTPPATITPTPAPPTVTATNSLTPLAPTPTLELSTLTPSDMVLPEKNSQSDSVNNAGLVIILGITGGLVLGWIIWQKKIVNNYP